MLRTEAYTVLDGIQVRLAVHCPGKCGADKEPCMGWSAAAIVPLEMIEKHGTNDATWLTIGRALYYGIPPEEPGERPWASINC